MTASVERNVRATVETSIEAANLFAEALNVKVVCERSGRDSIVMDGRKSDVLSLIGEIRRQGVSVKVVSPL